MERQRIALQHLYLAKSFEGIGSLIIVGTVAIKQQTIVIKAHITHKNLHIRVFEVIVDNLVCVAKFYFSGIGPCFLIVSHGPFRGKSR